MKTLIFPDIHEALDSEIAKIEERIAREAPDRVIFLGDYFDHYNDSPADAARIARWLKRSLADQRRTHLIGNHDASYIWPCEATYCPGFSYEKEKAIALILGRNWAHSLVFHTTVDSWLLTHAGLSATWMPKELKAEQIDRWLADEALVARANFAENREHWFVAVGPKRSGSAPAGGILWCDFRELRPTLGVKQIFGHTPGPNPKWISKENICLDTYLDYFAILQDGQLSVEPFVTEETQ